jgi:hypothetical protein
VESVAFDKVVGKVDKKLIQLKNRLVLPVYLNS